MSGGVGPAKAWPWMNGDLDQVHVAVPLTRYLTQQEFTLSDELLRLGMSPEDVGFTLALMFEPEGAPCQ